MNSVQSTYQQEINKEYIKGLNFHFVSDVADVLGHQSLTTTNIYAEVDLEMKAKALALCQVTEDAPSRHWREDKGLMAFLRTL